MNTCIVERRVETARIGLHTARRGSEEPLLFIGGSNFDMRLRRPVFDSALVETYDLVAYEPRGLGRSDAPDGPWTMADYAEDAFALIEALGWPEVLVVGESFGAMTALELAIRHPDRVRALCLLVGAPGGAGGKSFPIETFLAIADPRKRAEAALRIQDSRFLQLLESDPAGAQAKIEQRVLFEASFFGFPGNAAGYPRLLEARAGHDAFKRLAQIVAPTLVFSGVFDHQAPIEAGRAMAEAIPNASFFAIEGGHNLAFATSEPVDRILSQWKELP